MGVRVITKQLGGEEDLLLGEGAVAQERTSGTQVMTSINLAKWVTNAAALTALDATKFVRARLGDNNIPYRWVVGDVQTPDGDFIIVGTGGNWLKTIEQPTLKSYSELVNTPSGTSGAISLDFDKANVHELTITGNVTLSFTNPTPAGYVSRLTLILAQDGYGGATVTWPGSVIWAGGVAPTVVTTTGAISVLTFFTTDSGATWYGFMLGDDMS